MKKKIPTAIVLILITFVLISCNAKGQERFGVELSRETEYRCTDESRLRVRFYNLTDKSLSFVKIKMGEGKEYTLPQVVAASGVRYSDEYRIQFWVKGNSMRLYSMNNEGEWVIVKEGVEQE